MVRRRVEALPTHHRGRAGEGSARTSLPPILSDPGVGTRRSGRRLPFATDYETVIVDGPHGLGFKRHEVDIVGARHCQAGTAEDVWNIHPMVLEASAAPAAGSQGGGRRRREQMSAPANYLPDLSR